MVQYFCFKGESGAYNIWGTMFPAGRPVPVRNESLIKKCRAVCELTNGDDTPEAALAAVEAARRKALEDAKEEAEQARFIAQMKAEATTGTPTPPEAPTPSDPPKGSGGGRYRRGI